MNLPKEYKFGLPKNQTKKIEENHCSKNWINAKPKNVLLKRLAEKNRYLKEEVIRCSKIVDDYEYYDCSNKLYEKSKYKKRVDEWVKCGKTKCSKELENSLSNFV